MAKIKVDVVRNDYILGYSQSFELSLEEIPEGFPKNSDIRYTALIADNNTPDDPEDDIFVGIRPE